ncbi:MAG: hypothetical protein VYD81_02965 [Planctomycetota bacterium]|nr:hypothetical protein [Planctomycetota bacterium]
MKTLKNAGTLALVLLAGTGGYFLFFPNGLKMEVEQQGKRIDEVEVKAQVQQGRITENSDEIELLKKEVAAARESLTEARGELAQAKQRLGVAESDLKKLVEGALKSDEQVATLSERVEKLSRQQENLSGELQRRALKVQTLDERLKIHAIETDRRLRLLEDKAGLSQPRP